MFGTAPTSCAPTVLPPSPSQPKRGAGLAAIQRASCSMLRRLGCCAAALPSSTALRSPLSSDFAMALAASPSRPGCRCGDALAAGNLRTRCRPAPATQPLGASDHAGAHRHQPVVAQRVHAHHLGALLRGLAQALRRTADGPCAGTSRRQARAAGRRARRSSVPSQRTGAPTVRRRDLAQAEVDVLAAEAAHQLGEQVQFFDRADRRRQRADARRRRARPRSASGRATRSRARSVQSTLFHSPPCLIIGAVSRSGEFKASYEKRSRSAIQHSLTSSFSSGTTRITCAALDLDDQVGAGGIVRAHALAARQLPGTGAVAERLAGQRADRADVDHVARQLGVDRVADEGGDLGVLAATGSCPAPSRRPLPGRSGRSACSGCSGSSPSSRSAGRRSCGRRRACLRCSATSDAP